MRRTDGPVRKSITPFMTSAGSLVTVVFTRMGLVIQAVNLKICDSRGRGIISGCLSTYPLFLLIFADYLQIS